jgi:PIN domain nuclease of toxin-antitoxin system
MNLLLDTHTFIWWTIQRNKLSQLASDRLINPNNSLFLSLASVWEMQIKLQLGKLTFDLPLSELITSQQQTNGLQILPIQLEHILALGDLPNHHRDPFDRMLVAQSMVEQMAILSADIVLDSYPVQRIW